MNKFHARKIIVNGERFDSKKEYRRYKELELLQRAGEISDLQRQVRYLLIPTAYDEQGNCIQRNACYVADFVYRSKDGRLVVEDTKGVKTPEYILKKKLMYDRYGILICET